MNTFKYIIEKSWYILIVVAVILLVKQCNKISYDTIETIKTVVKTDTIHVTKMDTIVKFVSTKDSNFKTKSSVVDSQTFYFLEYKDSINSINDTIYTKIVGDKIVLDSIKRKLETKKQIDTIYINKEITNTVTLEKVEKRNLLFLGTGISGTPDFKNLYYVPSLAFKTKKDIMYSVNMFLNSANPNFKTSQYTVSVFIPLNTK